jgi:hypothetical protein
VSDGGTVAGGGLKHRHRLRQIGIVISAALVLVAIVLASQGSGGSESAGAVDPSPHFVDAADLTALADSLGHPLYWAGERPPAQLEVSEEADGSVYLRYLPPGVEAGDPRPGFLTVGTYPVADAVGALRRTAAKAGVGLEHAPDGCVILVNPSSAGSVYLAYPGSDLQIEVYDPAPGRSLQLIRAGAIAPVG